MKKWFLLILLVLGAISLFIDDKLSLFVNNESLALVFISLASITLINKFTIPAITLAITKLKQWKTIIPAFFSLGFFFVILKFLIARPRPFMELALSRVEGISYSFALWNSSFPSWHTATLAMLIPFVLKDKIRSIILYAIIISIAFSRLFSGIHYLSDVIFGFLIGYLVGELALRAGKLWKR